MSSICLSAVIPVGEMGGRLGALEKWLTSLDSAAVQVILICDLTGKNCLEELEVIIEKCKSKNIELYSGFFGAPGKARNFGLHHAIGDWVAFWDSDDIPNWHLALRSIEENPESDIIVGAFEKISDVDGSITPIYFRSEGVASVENDLVAYPGLWRFLFRIETFSGLSFEDFRMAEDQIFLLSTNPFGRRIKVVNEILYSYFWGGAGHLVDNRDALNDLLKSVQVLRGFLKKEDFKSKNFALRLLAKQTTTALLHGGWRLKLAMLNLIVPTRDLVRIPGFYRIYPAIVRESYLSVMHRLK